MLPNLPNTDYWSRPVTNFDIKNLKRKIDQLEQSILRIQSTLKDEKQKTKKTISN